MENPKVYRNRQVYINGVRVSNEIANDFDFGNVNINVNTRNNGQNNRNTYYPVRPATQSVNNVLPAYLTIPKRIEPQQTNYIKPTTSVYTTAPIRTTTTISPSLSVQESSTEKSSDNLKVQGIEDSSRR